MLHKKHEEEKAAEKMAEKHTVHPTLTKPEMPGVDTHEKAALDALHALAKKRGAHAVEFDTTNPHEWTVKLLRVALPKHDVLDPMLPEKSLGLEG